MRLINVHVGFASRLAIPVMLTVALTGCHKTQSGSGTSPPTSGASPLERPLLSARIDSISIYPVPNHAQDSAISLIVSVGNAGLPSTVQGWSLEVTSQGRSVPAIGPVHINGMVDAPGKSGTKIDLDKEDLAIKTVRVPIAKNSHVNGVLTFLLKDTRENKLANNGTSVVLHFDDFQSNSYLTSKGVIGAKKKAE